MAENSPGLVEIKPSGRGESRRGFLKNAARGIAAGSLGALVNPKDSKPEQDVFLKRGYQLVFESGVHAFRPEQHEEVRRRFEAGDLSAHLWPPQVAERMGKYKPDLIALDSLPYAYELPNARWWQWLPGSPMEMTGRNQALLLAGDPLYHTNLEHIGKEEGFGKEVRKKELEELYRLIILSITEGLGSLIVGSALTGVALRETHKIRKDRGEQDSRAKELLSRREFLQRSTGIVGGALLLATLGRAAPVLQSYLTDPQFTDLLNTITELTRPIIARSDWWLDGRTAFTIAKTRDAMKKLNLPYGSKASLVFGYPHAYEANPLLRDKAYRTEVMRKFAQHLINTVIEVNRRIPVWNFTEKEKPHAEDIIRNEVLDFLSWDMVYEVSEPHLEPGGDPKKAVLAAIKEYPGSLEDQFESDEVKEALAPLRSSYKKGADR